MDLILVHSLANTGVKQRTFPYGYKEPPSIITSISTTTTHNMPSVYIVARGSGDAIPLFKKKDIPDSMPGVAAEVPVMMMIPKRPCLCVS